MRVRRNDGTEGKEILLAPKLLRQSRSGAVSCECIYYIYLYNIYIYIYIYIYKFHVCYKLLVPFSVIFLASVLGPASVTEMNKARFVSSRSAYYVR